MTDVKINWYAQFIGTFTDNLTNQVQSILYAPFVWNGVVYPIEELYPANLIAVMRQCPVGTPQMTWYRPETDTWEAPDGSFCVGVDGEWQNVPPPPDPEPEPEPEEPE